MTASNAARSRAFVGDEKVFPQAQPSAYDKPGRIVAWSTFSICSESASSRRFMYVVMNVFIGLLYSRQPSERANTRRSISTSRNLGSGSWIPISERQSGFSFSRSRRPFALPRNIALRIFIGFSWVLTLLSLSNDRLVAGILVRDWFAESLLSASWHRLGSVWSIQQLCFRVCFAFPIGADSP